MALENNRGTAGNGTPTGTATTTLYAVLAALLHKSLIDPEFYRDQRYLRRLSFTVGTAASDKVMDGTTTDAAVYGLRVNLYGVTRPHAKRRGKPSINQQPRTHL